MSRTGLLVVEREPALGSRVTSRSSSNRPRGRGRGADLVDRLNSLEHEKRSRRHSHAGSLVLADRREERSLHEINDEIRALEAERQAQKYERRAEDERDLAYTLREQAVNDNRSQRERSRYGSEREYVVEKDVDYYREPSINHVYEQFRRERSRAPDELVLRDRERYGSQEIVYERAPSPPRNVVRVQKDNRGRMSLVRSSR